ncbi:MAG: hypothetical protein KKG47_16190 [Proteobacteria bacterium]|nr:hypothetical protein [Pseudomonadota bacterium]MBU1739617.1 hypothetical protein [Pseudomonadota bacterium]
MFGKKIFEEKITLRHGEKVVLANGVSLELKKIIYETIAANPDDPVSYPAGSGATVYLVLKKGSTGGELYLTMLSTGYVSELSGSWKGNVVRLEGVGHNSVDLIVSSE